MNAAGPRASGEGLRSGGDDLVVGDVAQMLTDIPAMTEGISELTVTVAPEHVLQRLAYLCAGSDGLGEDGVGFGDIEREHDRSSPDGRRRQDAHLGELVGNVQEGVSETQLHGHQPAVGSRDPLDLLGSESLAVERRGAVRALDDDVRGDGHATTVRMPRAQVLDVLAVSIVFMASERVRMWRAAGEDRVLLMAGQTVRYAIEPRGEFVFGIVTGQPMRARRGHERRLVRPGQLVAWDPSGAHAGTAVGRKPWTSRLMVVEVADLHALANDSEADLLVDIAFPDPVISDPGLADRFLRLHTALEGGTTRLEREERLAEWLRALIERSSSVRGQRPSRTPRDDRALRLAFEYLADQPERNVGLDELAAAAGIGKFRLVRLFRERTGLPPHALQVAQRIRVARRRLEAGESIADTAAATGFADQSHLHRHFQRSLGLTPREYQRRLRT